MVNENIVISKEDIKINGVKEFKKGNYYFVSNRTITGEVTILSDSKNLHRFSAKDMNKYFISKVDRCFMYAGYDYYNNDDKYYKLKYGGDSKEEITFDEYIKALIKWEFFKIS